MKHFKLQEFFHSETASSYGIENSTTSIVCMENAISLGNYVLDPLRDRLGLPIFIESGFRTIELNKLVGGNAKSQHLAGRAADIRPIISSGGDITYSAALKSMFEIIQNDLDFDQLIYYPKRGFIHVSYVSVAANRHSIIVKR